MWLKQFKSCKVPAVVNNIVVVGALTRCTLPHSVCGLKTAQIKVQRRLFPKLWLYELELGHIAEEATKNICFAESEGVLDNSKQMVQ